MSFSAAVKESHVEPTTRCRKGSGATGSCFRAYCAKCLKKHYNEDYNEIKRRGKKWLCPGCRDACSCAACVRKRYADPRDIPENLQGRRNSRFFKTNKRIIHQLTSG